MRAHKIVDRLFEIDVALQGSFLLGVRQCLTHQSSMAVARREVVALYVRGVELRTASVGCQHLDDGGFGTKQDMTLDFHHAPTYAPLLDLGIASGRIHHAFGGFARAAGTPGARWRFGRAVGGKQCGHIRWKLITRAEGDIAIGSGLAFGQNHGGFRFAALMAEMAQDAQAAGQRHGTPYPPIADIRGILRLAVRLFF